MRFFHIMVLLLGFGLVLAMTGCVGRVTVDGRAGLEGLKQVQLPTRTIDVKFVYYGYAVQDGEVAVTQVPALSQPPTRVYTIRWGYARITLPQGTAGEVRLTFRKKIYQPFLVTADTTINVESLKSEVR